MGSETGKKVVACLVARMKSTRLPRKSLADVCGKPLTVRLVERLRTAETVDEIVLCTSDHADDAVLVELAEAVGIKSVAGDPDDVLSRLQVVAAREGADVVLRVTGDNVFTDPVNIDRMVRAHIAFGADYTRTNGLPWGMTAEVLAADALGRLAAAIPDPNETEYLTLWAYDPERFRVLVLEAPEGLRRADYAVTVDTPEDLALVRRLWRELAEDEGGPTTAAIIRALDADPAYRGTPAESVIKLPGGETTTFGDFMKMFAERAAAAREKYGRRRGKGSSGAYLHHRGDWAES